MTLKEYIANGGRYYQKLHMGYDGFFGHVLKGIGFDGEPCEAFKQEAQDIKEGKALVVCPKGTYLTYNIMGNPTVGGWGVRVIFPRPAYKEDWENHRSMRNLRELTVEEILEMEKKYDEINNKAENI